MADDLAHEVKNPLHSMVINLELIRRRIDSSAAGDALARVDVVESEVARINRLVEALFQLMRPGRDPGLWADVAGVLADLEPVLAALAKVSRIELELSPPPLGSVVSMRRDALRHALLNLVVNALDSLAEGGGRRLTVAARQEDGHVVLVVSDDGRGLDDDVAERVGTPGFTTRAGRAGLGVAVARALAEEAGGTLEHEPRAGRGAVFALSLPRSAAR